MENTMIERAAKRMASINCPRSWSPEDGPAPFMSEAEREVHRALTRAVIEAMRDRDEAMLDAGTAVLWPHVQQLAPGSAAVAVYQAMIDAALDETRFEDATFIPIPTPFMQYAKPPQTPES